MDTHKPLATASLLLALSLPAGAYWHPPMTVTAICSAPRRI